MRQPQEREVAERALVRFQSGMCLHVASEVLFVQKRSLAGRTLDSAGQVDFRLGGNKRLEIDLRRMIFRL